jgi:hypothetical protein
MKKLRLDLDALAVESFEPQKTVKEEGTVRGFQVSAGNPSQCKSYCTFERCCGAEAFDGPC